MVPPLLISGEDAMNRTDRMLAIVLELQAKGWQRAEDLAAHFEVSKRTIYRDIDALCESGVPLVAEPGRGYSLDEGYFLPPLSFTADEATVLLLGLDYVTHSFDTQYQNVAESSASKIEAALPEARRAEVRQLRQGLRVLSLNPFEDKGRLDMLRHLRRAILQQRRIRFEYHTRNTPNGIEGEKKIREADPYALVHIEGVWYLVAHDYLRGDRRHFRLDRIDRLELLTKTFTRPADFRPEIRDRDDRPLVIRALFSSAVARWVQEERPYFMVAEEERPDGLLMTFKVRQDTDLLKWLLGWGGQVQVLEPESLRQKMILEAEAILKKHC
jgi:predicted DNA-binding transcriptional regulator YafY